MEYVLFARAYAPFVFSRRYWFAAVLAGAILFFLVGAIAFAHSLSAPSKSDSLAFKQLYTAGSAKPSNDTAFAAAVAAASPLEMHIANNGLVYLKNARIKKISNSAMTVGINWGSTEFLWTVQFSYSTHFWNRDGQKSTLEDIHVGDRVRITGALVQNVALPTIQAQVVHL